MTKSIFYGDDKNKGDRRSGSAKYLNKERVDKEKASDDILITRYDDSTKRSQKKEHSEATTTVSIPDSRDVISRTDEEKMNLLRASL